MDSNFTITVGYDNLPTQTFNGKLYKLHNGERYFSKDKRKMHWDVWEFYNCKRKKGYHIHHINNNSWDNRIENLQEVMAKEHLSEHCKKRFENNKEWFNNFHSKGIEAAKEWHSSPEGLQWHREQGKKTWENREYKTKECEECGKEYETRHSGKTRFCHLNCRAKSNRRDRKLRGECL